MDRQINSPSALFCTASAASVSASAASASASAASAAARNALPPKSDEYPLVRWCLYKYHNSADLCQVGRDMLICGLGPGWTYCHEYFGHPVLSELVETYTNKDVATAALERLEPILECTHSGTLYVTEWAVEEEHYRITEDGDEECDLASATYDCAWPHDICVFDMDYRWSPDVQHYVEFTPAMYEPNMYYVIDEPTYDEWGDEEEPYYFGSPCFRRAEEALEAARGLRADGYPQAYVIGVATRTNNYGEVVCRTYRDV